MFCIKFINSKYFIFMIAMSITGGYSKMFKGYLISVGFGAIGLSPPSKRGRIHDLHGRRNREAD